MVETLINGRWTLTLPEHRAARPQWLIENGGWELERLAALHDHIHPGTVVFDIGSEEGDFPALFTLWGGEVVLFEPNPYVVPNIKAIWDANHLPAPRGFFTGFAASNTNLTPSEMEMVFKEPDRGGWPACAYGPVIGDHGFRNVSERFHDTPQITVDDYCTSYAVYPDVVTMDVEGAELEVLRGAQGVLEQHRPRVFISVHPDFMRDMYGHTPDELHQFMDDLGYVATHLATDHEEHWMFETGAHRQQAA